MTMQLIDTHTHLYVKAFKNDIDAVMARALEAGVSRFYLPAIDSTETESMLQLESRYPGTCHAMMGLHPCSVKEDYETELKLVEDWLSKRKFVAVGEIGLDYYWDRSFTGQQKDAFHRQIEWALHYDIPIVIHSRNSIDDCLEIVGQHQKGRLRGIFHCFTESLEAARKVMDLGFYMGIGGVLTYKNSGLAEVVREIPLEYLVLETDAPYLTPVPFRGKRNESSYIKYVAEKLAEIKGISLEELAKITTTNAEKIFGS